MSEYIQRQKVEREVMDYWDNFIRTFPEDFKRNYDNFALIDKCKLRAFIQAGDSELYSEMLLVVGR